MTGGLQEQVTDGKEFFGIPIHPASKAIIGSQNVPYIFEDRVDKKQFIDALEKMYKMSKEERKEMGLKGRRHVLSNYSYEKYQSRWVEIIDEVHQKWGSWDNKKQNKLWTMEVV